MLKHVLPRLAAGVAVAQGASKVAPLPGQAAWR